MNFSIFKKGGWVICLIRLFINAEGNIRDVSQDSQIPNESNGRALTGYLASLMDYSYVVSYHYKESGRLFCSGFIISPYWTISVPNCFHIPIHYYRNKETHRVRKRNVDEYPYGSLSLKDSLTVTPKNYSKKELKELKEILSLPPQSVVVLTVFDKVYIPCESDYERTGRELVIHSSYETISHNAEIALLRVADSLTKDFYIKIPNIGPISLEGNEPTQCHVVGYGALKLNKTFYYHPMLSVIDVEVFAANMCQAISKTYNVTIDADPSNYVCSYNRKYRYGSPLSQGDSGAPLICGENIVGLSQWVFSPDPGYVSYGPSQPTPHIYTKLDVYWPWVLNYTGKKLDSKVTMLREKERGNASSIPSVLDTRIVAYILFIQYCLHYNTF